MQRSAIWLLALGIGMVDAVLLRLFEVCVNDGTDLLWNDLFRSDTYRWVVLPLAIGLSVALTRVIRLLHEKRVVKPELDLMNETDTGPVTLGSVGIILAIGLASLLAGASLGPEAALMASSAAIGSWVAVKVKLDSAKELLVLASIGALLVAFLGSIIMVLVPLLLLYQKKRLTGKSLGVVLVAGLSSITTLLLIDPKHGSHGTAPPLPQLAPHDFVVALVAGFVTALLALGLNRLIVQFFRYAQRFNRKVSGQIIAIVFGLVLGTLYLLGGQTVQFSGSAGSHMLVSESTYYGVAALLGLVLVKLLATGWSKATGYRGGLVFPSIYVGTALGLLIGQLHSGWGGAGAIVGGITGMLSAVTGSPVIAGVFVLAILPIRLLLVALVAIAGSVAGTMGLKRLVQKPGKHRT